MVHPLPGYSRNLEVATSGLFKKSVIYRFRYIQEIRGAGVVHRGGDPELDDLPLLQRLLRTIGRAGHRRENNHFTERCCGNEAGSYLRRIDSCITQLKT